MGVVGEGRRVRHRATGAVLLLAALVLAGCLGPPEPVLTPTEGPPITERASTGRDDEALLQGCVALTARFPVPASWAAERLPTGFRAEPFDATGALATLLSEALVCDFAQVGAGDLLTEATLWLWLLPADPPEGLRAAEVQTHAVALGAVAGEDALVRMLEDWGWGPVVHAPVTVAAFTVAVEPAWTRRGLAEAGALAPPGLPGGEMVVQSAGVPAAVVPTAQRIFLTGDGGTVVGGVDARWSGGLGLADGVATSLDTGAVPGSGPGAAVPALPGVGSHRWGDDHGVRLSPSPEAEASG